MNILTVFFKQTVGSIFWGMVICLPSLPSYALTVQEVPNPRQISGNWVSDSAEILKPETEAQLNQMINQLNQTNAAEIAVVTVRETKPAASPKAFATELFNYWHVGKQGKDNGILFLISKGDRRVEIETGYSVETILPDARIGSIIQQDITPRFKQGDFDGGTLAGTKALIMVLEGQEPSIGGNSSNAGNNFSFEIVLLIILLPIGLVSFLRRVPQRSIWPNLQGVSGFIIHNLFRKPIFLAPKGLSRTKSWHQWFEDSQVLHCIDCKQPLQQVEPTAVTAQLTAAQQVAEKLGSVEFSGWRCPNCSADGMHIRAYESVSDKFKQCPDCHELTFLKQESKVTQEPSYWSSGLLSTVYECQCCQYRDEFETEIPARAAAHNNIGSDVGGSFGGGSSGGGSFGGGSSGGGGAGGSW